MNEGRFSKEYLVLCNTHDLMRRIAFPDNIRYLECVRSYPAVGAQGVLRGLINTELMQAGMIIAFALSL